MDNLQLKEFLAEALVESVEDRRARLALANDYDKLDDQYKQLLDGLRSICEELGMKPAASCGSKDFMKRIRAQLYQKERCLECGFELVSSSTGCADEPDECLVCDLRAKVSQEEDRANQYMEESEALIRGLQHIGLEPGGQCVDIKTNLGAISLGLNANGKTFDVKWSK